MDNSLSLMTNVVQQVGRAIVTQKYEVNGPFPKEKDLCQQFNVSRCVVRPALKILAAKGLLHSIQRRGTCVLPEEHWNLLDPDVLFWLEARQLSVPLLIAVTEVRLGVEPIAAELAARRAQTEDIDLMEQALFGMENAKIGSNDPIQSKIDFYVALLKASGNQFFLQFRNLTETAIKHDQRFKNHVGNDPEDSSLEDHRKLLQAVTAKDPVAAKSRMIKLSGSLLDHIDKGIV